MAGQFGDTTYTKVFVGGLAWETQKDTMKNYFQQFGDILEAVVITDKATARSKGYGFVTFREPDAAMRACVDATPVIDGRKANCNLASLGVQRSNKASTPKHGSGGGRNTRVIHGGGFSFPNYSIQQGIPYNLYAGGGGGGGYSPYSSTEYAYPTSYYGGIYGGSQYSMYGSYYPYLNLSGEGGSTSAGGGYGVHYPHHFFHYPQINSTHAALYPHHFATPTTPLQSVCFAVPQA